MAGFKVVLFIAFTAATLITVTSRAVNISNTWVLPEEGFPVFYRYFRDRISWTEADAVCQFHHANLVTVDTTSQYDAVRAYLKELDIANNVWIGLSRTSDKRNFTWRDFRELSLTDYWQEAIPTGNDPLCAAMDPAADFRWHAFQCAGPSIAAFICELPVPTWATGPQGCLLTELPSLTVLYIPEQSAVELTSDCGLGGTKRIACKGNTDRDDMVRRLACDNTDVLDDKTQSPVPTVSNQDASVKTTKSWIWTSNTIDTGDYGLPTRHRRETEDTSPSSTNFKTDSLVTESFTVVTTITESEVETTASSSTSTDTEEFPSAINQGQLFSIIENGSVFDVIELNGTEENKTATVETGASSNSVTTVIYHKEPTEDSASMQTNTDDGETDFKGKSTKFNESVKKVKTLTKFIDKSKKSNPKERNKTKKTEDSASNINGNQKTINNKNMQFSSEEFTKDQTPLAMDSEEAAKDLRDFKENLKTEGIKNAQAVDKGESIKAVRKIEDYSKIVKPAILDSEEITKLRESTVANNGDNAPNEKGVTKGEAMISKATTVNDEDALKEIKTTTFNREGGVEMLSSEGDAKIKSTRSSEEDLKMKSTLNSEDDLKMKSTLNSEEDLKMKSTLNSEEDLKMKSTLNSEDDLKMKSTLNREEDLKMKSTLNSEDDLKMKSTLNSEKDLKMKSTLNSEEDLKMKSTLNSDADAKMKSIVNSEENAKIKSTHDSNEDVRLKSTLNSEEGVRMKSTLNSEEDARIKSTTFKNKDGAKLKSTTTDFINKETNQQNPLSELNKTTTTETDFLNKEIDLYPINTNPLLKLNRTNRKELPNKPDDNINIDIDNNLQEEQHKTVEITLHHPGQENMTKSTLFVTTRRVKKIEEGESTTVFENEGSPVTKSPTEESLAAEPTVKPNRQRQLTRPQRRSFYPYFFSRVLG